MTTKEAIKHFRSLQKRYTTEHNGKMCEKVALALEAMEKQVPKKPIIFITDRYDDPTEAYKCSVCQSEELLCKGDPYCSECGNAVDWSDVE
ncbi:MAG: hypothetical protein MJ230_07240 [bacterium]|nr:hypothetical protein [bacterium]